MKFTYAFPPGGLPPQRDDPSESGAVFTTAYAFIPASVMRDIVTSLLPGWRGTRAWILARPLSGFAETFAQYAVEVEPGGGSDHPEPDPGAQAALLVAGGEMKLTIDGQTHTLGAGGYAYLPPGHAWTVQSSGDGPLRFHWIRKRWVSAPGLTAPEVVIDRDREVVKHRAVAPGDHEVVVAPVREAHLAADQILHHGVPVIGYPQPDRSRTVP